MTDPTATGALHPDLARLDREIRATLANFETLCDGLTETQFNWRDQPGRWSIAQVLAHLNAVNGQDLAPLTQAIRSAASHGNGPFRYAWHWRWFLRNLEPPVKFKAKAPKSYLPPPTAALQPTLEEYRRICNELLSLLPQANGLDLVRVRTLMPALRFLKMPLGARLAIIAAHDRRHLWQARQLRQHPAFPA